MSSSTGFVKSKVVKNTQLNQKFHHITLELQSQNFSFKPGQSVLLKAGEGIFRHYTIFSTPDKLPAWEMFVDITPGGPGTTCLKNLQAGEFIETTQPHGAFTLESSGQNYIFGATGCGLAAVKPMVEELFKRGDSPQIYLFWGLRFEEVD